MAEMRMDLDRARRIVSACVVNVMLREGVSTSAPSLAEYSLGELVEANRLVREANAREGARPADGAKRTTHVVCDDRLIAALYVACHYDAEDPAGCRPLAVGRLPRVGAWEEARPVGGVFVIDMAFHEDGGIVDRPPRSDREVEEEYDRDSTSAHETWCPGCWAEPIPVALANRGRQCRTCEEGLVESLAAGGLILPFLRGRMVGNV